MASSNAAAPEEIGRRDLFIAGAGAAALVAAIVVFVLSSVYYSMLGVQWAEVSDTATPGERPPPSKLAGGPPAGSSLLVAGSMAIY